MTDTLRVAAVVAFAVVSGPAATAQGFTTGRDLLVNATAWQRDASASDDGVLSTNEAAYFQAFVSAAIAEAVEHDQIVVPNTLNIVERCRIVAAFLEGHTDRLDERAATLIVDAIREAVR